MSSSPLNKNEAKAEDDNSVSAASGERGSCSGWRAACRERRNETMWRLTHAEIGCMTMFVNNSFCLELFVNHVTDLRQ